MAISHSSFPARQRADRFASIEMAGDACPGLFYQTAAQDDFLTRIRVPGGILNCAQAAYLAAVAQQSGHGQIWLTNRANIQLRLDTPQIAPAVLASLQRLGLAAACAEVDHLRNLMASPTAGIDTAAHVDMSPLVRQLDRYFSTHPELAPLSAKFSIGLDGGEALSIGDRRNDIYLVAESSQPSAQALRLLFGMGGEWIDSGLVCALDQVIDLIGAISRIYRETASIVPVSTTAAHRRSRKPRWRQVVDYLGVDALRDRLSAYTIPAALPVAEPIVRGAYNPYDRCIGIHPQSQPGQFYAGIVVPLGKLHVAQWQQLTQLATAYGNGELRLTPWQNVIIPNIDQARLGAFQRDLAQLGLSCDVAHPASAIVACSGLPGCASSLTATQVDATQIIQHLVQTIALDQPLNIHVSGCAKGCAQPDGSDITLMGQADPDGKVGYAIYLRSPQHTFGRLLWETIQPAQLSGVIARIVQAYQRSRLSAQESFSQFTQRQSIAQLQVIFGFEGGVG